MKQNITLSLDRTILQKLKILAAQRNTSVSGMLTDELNQLIQKDEHYQRSKLAALQAIEQGYHLGGQPLSRDELHER